jgi:hypothetical protein
VNVNGGAMAVNVGIQSPTKVGMMFPQPAMEADVEGTVYNQASGVANGGGGAG